MHAESSPRNDAPEFKQVGEGDYETADGRYRIWRTDDDTWSVEDNYDEASPIVEDAMTFEEALARLGRIRS